MTKTIQTTLHVSADGKATLELPADITPGEHKAVVVIEQATASEGTRPPLNLSRYDVTPADPNCTFRREDLYGDDGR